MHRARQWGGRGGSRSLYDVESLDELAVRGLDDFEGVSAIQQEPEQHVVASDRVVEVRVIRIRDCKSGRIPPSRQEVEANLQLALYDLAAAELWPWARRIEVGLDLLRHDRVIAFERSAEQRAATRSYRARAVEHQFGIAETGTEQVAVTFVIQSEGNWYGHRITWFGYFTEGTMRRTMESLRTCGWMGDDVTDLVGLDGNEVELEVAHEEYKGELRPRVKWVNRLPGAKVKHPMTPEQKRALSARMWHLAVATRARVTAVAAPSLAAALAANGRGGTGGAAPGSYPGL